MIEANAFLFGHKITSRGGQPWTYDDTGTPIPEDRECPNCHQHGADGCDPCLGRLPGVFAACCGHGVEEGYISFENGITVRGRFEVEGLPSAGPPSMHGDIELKPCPFCGGEGFIVSDSDEDGKVFSLVACKRCLCQIDGCYSCHGELDSERLAAHIWNLRVGQAQT